jgi:hypothetical protein
MPTINVGLDKVESFTSLPEGKYLGSVDKIEFREARDPTKFDQLMATYLVIDGDHTGSKQSEFLSLSPKAAFRLKRWFDKFGLGDVENLEIDDDTNLLIEPDLVGVNVIFQVRKDGKIPGTDDDRIRTELLSVEDEVEAKPAPKAVAKPSAKAVAGDPVDEKAAKIAAAKAALAALESDDEPEAEAEDEPAAKPRVARAPAVSERPARRTLR